MGMVRRAEADNARVNWQGQKTGYTVGDLVRCRDPGGTWGDGVVTKVHDGPYADGMVLAKRHGDDEGAVWDEVEHRTWASGASPGMQDASGAELSHSLWGARHDCFVYVDRFLGVASLGVLRRVNKAWKAGIESNVWAWEAAARSLLGSMWQPAGCSWHDGCCAYPARACDGRRSAGLKPGKAPPLVIDTSAQGTRRPGSPAMRLPSSTLPTLVWELASAKW